MGAHSLLSPSSAHRWLNCTAAPRLEAGVPDTAGGYAEEGTLAHAVGAMKLKGFLGLDTREEAAEAERLARYRTGEMDGHTDGYKAAVLERYAAARAVTEDARLLVETRLDLGDYIPEASGTADAVIIADGVMEVLDLKYGKGVRVSAYRNPQMMIYALGAYGRFSFEYRIERVRMTIVQPRLDNLSCYGLSVAELLEWADGVLRPRAREAYRGDGPQTPGVWCRFCRVRSRCRALASLCAAASKRDPRLMDPEELASEALPMAETVETWLAGVRGHALRLALGGVRLPGWKLVEGRSIRRITDTDGAAAALVRAGYKASEIYRPRELRPITELERLTRKSRFAGICGAYVEKPQGKPTLAPESDRRGAIDPVAEDFGEPGIWGNP